MVKKVKVSPVVIVEGTKPRNARRRSQRKERAVLREELIAEGKLDSRTSRARRNFSNRRRNQNPMAGQISGATGLNGRRMFDTMAGESVLQLAVDPFSYDQDLQIGWPDGTAEQVVTPHLTGQLPQLGFNTGYFSTGTAFVQLDNAVPWGTIIYYDPDVSVVFGMNYQGNLSDPLAKKTFWVERTLYGSKILNNNIDYAGARLISCGFTCEFTGNITANQGQSTVVQVPIQCKQSGPHVADIDVITYEYYAKILPLEDPTLGDMDLASNAFLEILPQDDNKVFRSVADIGHCSSLKILRPELPVVDFGFNTDDDAVITRGRYWNPLYVAFYGSAITHSPTESLSLTVDVPSDILLHRQHNVMIAHYTGLSPQASFRLKTRERPECTLTTGSALNFFSHSSLEIDRNAMDSVREMHVKMMSAYPSEYNSIGGFFKKVWNGMKKVVPIAKPFIGLLPGGGLINDGLEMIGLSQSQNMAHNNIQSKARSNTMRRLKFGLGRLALSIILLLPLVFAQPIQTIVCNNPATPDICGPNLPVFTSDESVVAAIAGLGNGDQEILSQILLALKPTAGTPYLLTANGFLSSTVSWLNSIDNHLVTSLDRLESIRLLITESNDLLAGITPFPAGILDEYDGQSFLRVGNYAQQVVSAHYSNPFWSRPAAFADSNSETCFQTSISDQVCSRAHVPIASGTCFQETFDANSVCLPLPITTTNGVRTSALLTHSA